MSVDNLVFNKLGNSFSVMLSSEGENVQLWDSVILNEKYELHSVSTVPFKFNEKNIYFTCILKNKENFHGIYFYNHKKISFFVSKNLNPDSLHYIKGIDFEFEHTDDFFTLKNDNAELIFNLSMKNLQFIKLENGSIYIPEQNFLKGVLEIF
jgi:hypothetical protein